MKIDKTLAVIIGIEDYSYSKSPHNMTGVEFAKNDASEFKKCIQEVFSVSDDNILYWLDSDANRTRIENDLPYFISGLAEEDTLIFYFAGHGFHKEGENRITAWDTHPTNLSNTTISLKEVLFDPLRKSNCKRCFVFLDACSTFLNDIPSTRDIISNLDKSEFETFVKSKEHTAIYLASSPGQPSFPSKTLKHGIWTFHLIEALRGNAFDALYRNEWVTDVSLKDYLSFAIPDYIRRNTTLNKIQQPYAIISAGHTFEIIRINKSEESLNWKNLNLDIEKAYFRNEEKGSIHILPGFQKRKGHFVPDYYSSKVSDFIRQLLSEDVKEESKAVYDRAKSILNLRHKEIFRDNGTGSANVDCKYFRFEINSDQHPENPSDYILSRIVIIRTEPNLLPNDFDDIFPEKPDVFVVPISGTLNFDNIADQFEELSERIEGIFYEDEDRGIISLKTKDGTKFIVNLNLNQFVIYPDKQVGCLKILKAVNLEIKNLLEFTTNSFLIS